MNPYKRKFVRYFTNKVLYFNNVVTLKAKSSYTMLKRKLKILIGDLLIVVANI